VELGENLAGFARERLAAFPFTVEVGKFEDASLQPASADWASPAFVDTPTGASMREE
jgi:hypothetical protein